MRFACAGRSSPGLPLVLLIVLLIGGSSPAPAALDLARAEIGGLANGLTLVVLEDHTFPVVSVQMLYRVGARDEEVGRTGLAHFLEHMAFRATENFPDTGVVSEIYGVGGEWHGYTWIDQTTYFETVPKEHLDLILRIEADRMGRLLIPASEVEAERGAVLSELHGYENDPATILLDTVVATSFLQHPYRNNTIGWQSDVERVEHRDLIDFYRRHYHPANAVLAVVGDVDPEIVRERVGFHFGKFEAQPATESLWTVEPVQRGERRVRIDGQGGDRRFVMAYRAPAAGSPEWPVLLVLQEILGGGEGVNFLHNEWGVPVRSGTRLAGIVDDMSTWYPPSKYPYLFVISGSLPVDASMSAVEERIDQRIGELRRRPVGEEELSAARRRAIENLILEVQTTEDAAHQLATFAGYGVLAELIDLPAAIERVTAPQIQGLVVSCLLPHRRTVGWYVPVDPAPAVEVEDVGRIDRNAGHTDETAPATASDPTPTISRAGFDPPMVRTLTGGLTVIIQRVALSPTAYLRLVIPSANLEMPGNTSRDSPVWRWTSLNREFLAGDLGSAALETRQALDASAPRRPLPATEIEDPEERLEAAFENLLGVGSGSGAARPAIVVLVGDLKAEPSLEILEESFGDLVPAQRRPVRPLRLEANELEVSVPFRRAQAQLGYVVPAPLPGFGDALTWRVLLYILTHGYEGRLGKEAISRRGLVYYIDSSYRSDGGSSWVALKIGVDPPKLDAMRRLLVESLAELERRPPTEAEIEEARNHLVGRWRSAAQSNEEISATLAMQWIGHGRLLPEAEYLAAVRAVSREDILRAIPEFIGGALVVVKVPE